MPFPLKFTAQRGKVQTKDIAIVAGAPEAQTDTISINMDITKLSRGEALTLIDNIKQVIHSSKWPAI